MTTAQVETSNLLLPRGSWGERSCIKSAIRRLTQWSWISQPFNWEANTLPLNCTTYPIYFFMTLKLCLSTYLIVIASLQRSL